MHFCSIMSSSIPSERKNQGASPSHLRVEPGMNHSAVSRWIVIAQSFLCCKHTYHVCVSYLLEEVVQSSLGHCVGRCFQTPGSHKNNAQRLGPSLDHSNHRSFELQPRITGILPNSHQ